MKKSIVVLFHFVYWGIYTAFIWGRLQIWIELAQNVGVQVNDNMEYMAIRELIGYNIFASLLVFYIFYTILFPRFLLHKKIIALISSGILVSILAVSLGNVLIYFSTNYPFYPGVDFIQIGAAIFTTLAHGTVALVMKGFFSWYQDIKLKEELKTKNHEMELALVKSQLDPHFLFNTINNIDILIQKNATKASKYLNSLSDILRFMLFEAKTDKIPLHQEIEYIQKYVNLQKIRTANPDYVNFQIEGETDKLMIAPMLFIPFIENAFKHTSNKKVKNAIEINIKVEENKIVFQCQNRGNENLNLHSETNGLGNELIQKRLQLLYPDRHTLKISKNEDLYKVKLTLNNENELYNN